MSEANRGFGSAALMNYPPLGGYLTGAVSLLTGDLVSAFLVVLVVITALSGVTFYACARLLAPPVGAALGTVLYLLAPYRLIDLHARFAFAEVLAFLWLPLIVKFLFDLRRQPRLRSWTGLVVVGTGLVVTHVLSALMVLVVLGPVVLWTVARERNWRSLAGLAAAGVTVFVCASFYLLPLLVERGSTHIEYLTGAWWGDWRGNFLFSEVTGPMATVPPIRPLVERGFWYAFALLVVSTGLAWRSRQAVRGGLIAAGLIAVVLQLGVSGVIWRLLPGMELLQFPWRFQALLTLVACLLFAVAAARSRWPALLLFGLASTAAVLFAVLLWRGIAYDVTAAAVAEADIGGLVFKEHMPRGVENWQRFEELPLAGAARVVTTSAASVEVGEWSSHRRRVGINAAQPTQVALRTFHYPGWAARLDGVPVDIEVLPPLHTLGVKVPAGEHVLEVEFAPTPVRVLGSVVSVLAAGFLALANLRRQRRAV
jgi:uncharacterized membrane protein